MQLFFTVIVLLFVNSNYAKYMEGDLNSGDNWVFIARFCFLSLSGKFEYEVEYPEVRRPRPKVKKIHKYSMFICLNTLSKTCVCIKHSGNPDSSSFCPS